MKDHIYTIAPLNCITAFSIVSLRQNSIGRWVSWNEGKWVGSYEGR